MPRWALCGDSPSFVFFCFVFFTWIVVRSVATTFFVLLRSGVVEKFVCLCWRLEQENEKENETTITRTFSFTTHPKRKLEMSWEEIVVCYNFSFRVSLVTGQSGQFSLLFRKKFCVVGEWNIFNVLHVGISYSSLSVLLRARTICPISMMTGPIWCNEWWYEIYIWWL